MSDDVQVAPVRAEVHVEVTQQQAFAFFSGRMKHWWNPDFSLLEQPFVDIVVEPRPDGRWFEVDAEGHECQWGRVLAWEPDGRLLLAWQLTAEWTFDPDLVTELEITFTPDGDGTRVRLEHRGLEAYGDAGPDLMRQYEGAGGWRGLLTGYAERLGG